MRLIDGNALIEKFNEKADMAECLIDARTAERFATFCALADAVEEMPIVDAEVVVRCRDCEYAERYERIDGIAGYYCGHPQNIFTYGERWDRVFKPVKETDDFCSYGQERMRKKAVKSLTETTAKNADRKSIGRADKNGSN